MRARKRFGQHFLTDLGMLERIHKTVNPKSDDLLLEIGPGRGALTDLFYGETRRYRAIEIDRDLIALLEARYPALELINADVLRIDLAELLADGAYRIVGNLPYNISTPLLAKFFALEDRVRDLTIMLQKEVADRLCAVPATKAYGRLSVTAQVHCRIELLFAVPPQSFNPPPAVESAVVGLWPQAGLPPAPVRAALDLLLRLAFQQRRKRVANALKTLAIDWDATGVDPNTRPDQIAVDGYLALAYWLADRPETEERTGL